MNKASKNKQTNQKHKATKNLQINLHVNGVGVIVFAIAKMQVALIIIKN
jgi:hypothetical protein